MENTRHRKLLEHLRSHGDCTIADLARTFGTSAMTIRRDLKVLAEDGHVLRTFGGAAPAPSVAFEFNFLAKAQVNREAKEQIAATACERVRDGQSLLLDSGTTTLALARRLKSRRNLRILTTSLPIASELQYCENVEVVLLGGTLRRGSPDLTGPLTESILETVHCDLAFIGADGIDERGNVYNDSLLVGRMLAKMAAAADRVYVVADHSKANRKALSRFGRLAEWDGLVVDAAWDRRTLNKLERAGVHVIRPRQGKSKG